MKYNSETHGPIEISDMHGAHLRNAIAKMEAKERTTDGLTVEETQTLQAMREQANSQTPDLTDE